jgi:hypothetical protein
MNGESTVNDGMAWLGLSGALILPFCLVGPGRNQQQETKANVVFKAMLLIWIRIQLEPKFLARSEGRYLILNIYTEWQPDP